MAPGIFLLLLMDLELNREAQMKRIALAVFFFLAFLLASNSAGAGLVIKSSAPSFVCGTSTVLDADGNSYGTVLIGTQCWMASNMNIGTKLATGATEPTDNSIIEKWCYNNDDSICATDGGLYNWNEAMKYSTTEGAQGICPSGWHVPKDSELYALENYLKDTGATCDSNRHNVYDCTGTGTKLKSGTPPGMNIPLAGLRGTGGSFTFRTSGAGIWSSSESGASAAWDRCLGSGVPTVGRYADAKARGFSVRCLRDTN
jgi:uncharacterized protein (TIGR02145 family)